MQSLPQPVVEVISHQDDKGHSILLVDFSLEDPQFVEYYLNDASEIGEIIASKC